MLLAAYCLRFTVYEVRKAQLLNHFLRNALIALDLESPVRIERNGQNLFKLSSGASCFSNSYQQLRKVDSGHGVCRSDADGPFEVYACLCHATAEQAWQLVLQTCEHAQWTCGVIRSVNRNSPKQNLFSLQNTCCCFSGRLEAGQ